MFNREAAEEARSRLERAVDLYNERQKDLTSAASELHGLRDGAGKIAIVDVEAFVSSLAGHPKEFDKTIGLFKMEFENFTGVAKRTEEAMASANIEAGVGAGVGVAAGAATAAMAPTAALAIATTFGTASTGTAISALSGAAATNAALAWLGGGALAAGGGGMASGGALLAMAGPIGWGIAGVALAGGGLYYASKNKDIANEANEKTEEILKGGKVLELAHKFVAELRNCTAAHVNGIRQLLSVTHAFPSNYTQLSKEQLEVVGAIINHVQVLTELMKRTVTEFLRLYDALDAAKKATQAWPRRDGADEASQEADLTAAKQALEAYCGVLRPAEESTRRGSREPNWVFWKPQVDTAALVAEQIITHSFPFAWFR